MESEELRAKREFQREKGERLGRKGKMPAFEWSMEQKDREDVLAYVRALGKR